MTSTSSDPVVLRDLPTEDVGAAPTGSDLRSGSWTRLGDGAVVGDPVTEAVLGPLAERVRAAARAEGYAAGWAEGRRRAAADAERETAERRAELDALRADAAERQDVLLAALRTTVDRAGAELRERQADLGVAAVDLALDLVQTFLGRELEVAREPGLDAVRRAVAAVETDVRIVVRLHPDDLATVHPDADLDPRVTLLADPSLGRGDAVAETADNVVDATVAGALARVREVLGR